MLFPDTFNNYLHTDVGVACVEAIEAAGWRVIMPSSTCCGGRCTTTGSSTAPTRYLRRVLDALREYVRDGTPSSAWNQLRSRVQGELRKMLPHDDDAAGSRQRVPFR